MRNENQFLAANAAPWPSSSSPSPPHYILCAQNGTTQLFFPIIYFSSLFFNCPRGVRTGFHGNAVRTMGCWSSANWFPGLSCRRDEPVLPPRAHGHHGDPIVFSSFGPAYTVCVITHTECVYSQVSLLVTHRTHTHRPDIVLK